MLFCGRKESIQQLLLTTVLTSLIAMTTSRNWLKDTKDTKVCWALKLNEWAKACREHMDESNLTEMSLRLTTETRWVNNNELFAFESFRLVSLMIHV